MDGLKISSGPMIGTKGIGQESPFGKSRSTSEGSETFADTLKKAVGSVNEMQLDADAKMQDIATGKSNNIADVMISAEKADIALRLMTQVRNKIIDAYQEVMKMQV